MVSVTAEAERGERISISFASTSSLAFEDFSSSSSSSPSVHARYMFNYSKMDTLSQLIPSAASWRRLISSKCSTVTECGTPSSRKKDSKYSRNSGEQSAGGELGMGVASVAIPSKKRSASANICSCVHRQLSGRTSLHRCAYPKNISHNSFASNSVAESTHQPVWQVR